MEGLDTDLGGAFPESSEGSLHNRGGRSEDSGATEGKRQLQPDDIRGDKTGGLRVWSPGQQWSQGVVPGPAAVSGCGPRASSGLRVWSPGQQWSQGVVPGPAVVSGCGPRASSGLRVWSLDLPQ